MHVHVVRGGGETLTTLQATQHRPCGLCASPVHRSDFEGGRARLLQGVLYCVECSAEVERARVETLAFKQSLARGGVYTCGACRAPVPFEDVRGGAVVYVDDQLNCRACASDLLKILARARKGRANGSARLRPQMSAPIPGRPADVTATGRLRAAQRQHATDEVLVPSARTTCAGCDDPVEQADVASGRALVRSGDTFCLACSVGVGELLNRSCEALTSLGTFECNGCAAKITTEDLLADRAVRARGELYCATCKQDFGRSSMERGGKVGRPSSVTVLPTVPCSRCARSIRPLEARTGKAHVVGDKMMCGPCKDELDGAAARRRRRTNVACAHCQRAIKPREVEQKKVVQHGGNLYCARCGKDPAVVLAGKAAAPDRDACGACGGALEDGICIPCAAKMAVVQEASLHASSELERALAPRCEACGKDVHARDVESGEAVKGGRTLCQACAKPAARCGRCRGALAHKGAACAACAAKEQRAKVEAEEWMGLSAEGAVELSCGRCRSKIAPEELRSGRARSTAGTLECGACVARRPAAGATGPAARDCPTCDARIQGAGYDRGGRHFCSPCGEVFERLLAGAKLAPGEAGPCKLCKRPASGDAALRLERDLYCAACRRSADLLVQLVVRDERRRRPRRALPPVLLPAMAAVAVLVVVACGAAVLGRGRRAAPAASVAAATAPARTTAPAAEEALRRVQRLVDVPPRTYEEAVTAIVAVERELPLVRAEPALALAAADVTTRARAARDAFAPSVAAKLLDEARRAAVADDPRRAAQALRGFPQDLAGAPAASLVAEALARYEALAECTTRGRDLLRGRPTASHLLSLLGSAPAQLCAFAETALGRTLDAEMRRLRNAERTAPDPAANAPTSGELDVALAKAAAAEARGDLAAAEASYRRLLGAWPDAAPPQVGLARVALLRELPGRARREADRAARLSPSSPEVAAILAWLDLLEPAGEERARARLAAAPGAERTATGRRLQRVLALGAPSVEGRLVRIYSRGVPAAELTKLALDLERAAQLAADAAGVPDEDARVAVALLEGADRERVVADLGPVSADGRLPGAFLSLPATRDLTMVTRAVAAAVVARAQVAPAWLIAALPDALASASPAMAAAQRLPLSELESMGGPAVLGNARARQTAAAYAALARTPGGARVIAGYAVDRVRSPAKARAELESALRALGGGS